MTQPQERPSITEAWAKHGSHFELSPFDHGEYLNESLNPETEAELTETTNLLIKIFDRLTDLSPEVTMLAKSALFFWGGFVFMADAVIEGFDYEPDQARTAPPYTHEMHRDQRAWIQRFADAFMELYPKKDQETEALVKAWESHFFAECEWFECIRSVKERHPTYEYTQISRNRKVSAAFTQALKAETVSNAQAMKWVATHFTELDIPAWLCEVGPLPLDYLPATKPLTFPIHTGQEMDTLLQSGSDGHHGAYWKSYADSRNRVYERPGNNHFVSLGVEEEETDLDTAMGALKWLTDQQDADFIFAALYVCNCLAPVIPLPSSLARVQWVDLDEVMEKIGWQPGKLSLSERAEKRAKIWHYIVYGDRAAVSGKRSGTYKDKHSGEVIETTVDSPPWRITSKERPLQCALFGEVPLRVELALSKQWEPLLTHASLAQYLPCGEALAAIPAGQPSGAMARAISIALANLWRRKPRETEAGTIKPTREELLTHYTPKLMNVSDFLESKNPQRFVAYWYKAMGILVEIGWLSKEGEPSNKTRPNGYGWQEKWLKETVEITPGTVLNDAIKAIASNLPPLRPRDLKKPKRSRKKTPKT